MHIGLYRRPFQENAVNHNKILPKTLYIPLHDDQLVLKKDLIVINGPLMYEIYNFKSM